MPKLDRDTRSAMIGMCIALLFVFALSFVSSDQHDDENTKYAAQAEQHELLLGISSEGWTAIFTGLLTLSTVGLWIVTWLALRHAEADSSRQFKQTEKTLEQIATQAKAALDAADAAKRANDISHKAMVSDHRPWVAITEIEIISLFIVPGATPPNDHSLWIQGAYRLTNSGNTPARNTVNWHIAEPRNITPNEMSALINQCSAGVAGGGGRAIAPHSDLREEFTARIEFAAPPTGTTNTILLYIGIGVTYRCDGLDTISETAQTFDIFQRQAPNFVTPTALDFATIQAGTLPDMIYRRQGISRMT